MKKATILFVAVHLSALTTTAAVLQRQQQMLADKMIRLHIVANSDTKYDQDLKLEVRDAVLSVTREARSKAELASMLPRIEAAAKECLRKAGSGYSVKVSLQKEYFPTRIYSTFSLPAGAYHALRVTVGEGAGHNWWCVLFPSICLCAAADLKEAAAAAGFTDREVGLITQDGLQYKFKFKALELLQQAKQWAAQYREKG